MLKRILVTTTLVLTFTLPGLALGQGATVPEDQQTTITQLKEQIKALQVQITALTKQIEGQNKEIQNIKTEVAFTQTLQRGMTGDEVTKLQTFLKQFPDIYPEGLVTGYYGSLTETAVRKLQEKQGLEPVGMVGPKTLVKLNALAATDTVTAQSEPATAPSTTRTPIPTPTPTLPVPGTTVPTITTATTSTQSQTTQPPNTAPSGGSGSTNQTNNQNSSPSITQTSQTTTSTVGPTGVCQVRNSVTSVVAFSASDLGTGYAKLAKSGVNTISGLRSVCTQSDYDTLLANYCKSNSNSVQQEVVVYDSQGNVSSTGGGPFGSNPVYCPAAPTTTTTNTGTGASSPTIATTSRDTTPPSAPSNLSAVAISSSQINLSWLSSHDNVMLVDYNIKVSRDGWKTTMTTIDVPPTSADTMYYSNTGLEASTTYLYTVTAYDASWNASTPSASVGATTK